MGCGREKDENTYHTERELRTREGFRAIASNDQELQRFVDKLENVLRLLHEVKAQDLAMTQRDHRRIDGALEGARSLMETVMSSYEKAPADYLPDNREMKRPRPKMPPK